MPTITTQPQDVNAPVYSDVSFSVVSPDATSYQWEKYVSGSFVPISGATSDVLNLSNITDGDFSTYRVVVSDGVDNLTSDTADLIEAELTRWDVDNPDNTNGDTLLFTLDPENPTTVGIATDENTVDFRTGEEYLGVQFLDRSTSGDPDMIFSLDDGATTFDAEIEFYLDDGNPL